MEKIFKKSLALVLSAALCLTALVGCLTVSAADETTPAYAISTDAKGKVGDTVEVIAEYTDISTVCGHYVTVTFPANFTVNEVYQAKESADGEVYKLLTAYKEDSQDNWQYKMDVVEGKTAIKSCDIINFFASEGSEHNVTTGSLKFKFVVTIGEVEVGEYPVNIAVEAASQEEKWITPALTNGKITVEANTPAHEHKWDAGVMTTMPTTTSNGVITYTCSDCEETRTEDFVVGGTISLNAAKTSVDVALVKVGYGSIITADVFSTIKANGGTNIAFGMLLTRDGSVPEFKEGITPIYEYTGNIPAGKKANANGYFQGMNFAQMGQTLSFRTYVQFTLNDQVCYYYGETYSKVFIDSIRSNTDEKSVALVSLYDSKATATNINAMCTGTTVESGIDGITVNASKTFLDMANIKVQYGSTIYASVFSTIKDNGGTNIAFGMLLTRDGSVPEFKEGVTPIYEYTGNIPAGKNANANGYFQGMNFAQMGQTLTYRTYVRYTNSAGETVYEYGSAVSFVFIDILKSLAGENAYANDLISYYNTYIAK